jgi:hypothetical protein
MDSHDDPEHLELRLQPSWMIASEGLTVLAFGRMTCGRDRLEPQGLKAGAHAGRVRPGAGRGLQDEAPHLQGQRSMTKPSTDGLLALDRDRFKELVDNDVRGRASAAQAEALRTGEPEITERWYHMLVLMKKNVESTLAAKKEECKLERLELIAQAEEVESRGLRGEVEAFGRQLSTFDPESGEAKLAARALRVEADVKHRTYLKWRTGALRFRAALEERISEAAWRRQTTEKRVLLARYAELSARVESLTAGIRAHRAGVGRDDEGAPDGADLELWRLLRPAESTRGRTDLWGA